MNVRRWNWATWIVAISTLAYCIVSLIMFLQMKKSNDLTRKYQEQNNRPFLLQEVVNLSDWQNRGQSDETWTLQAGIANNGPIPATKVLVGLAIDNDGDRRDVAPAKSPVYSISPNGGRVLCGEARISRAQVLQDQEDRRNVYLHCSVTYEDPSGNRYESSFTYRLDYKLGEKMDWIPLYADVR